VVILIATIIYGLGVLAKGGGGGAPATTHAALDNLAVANNQPVADAVVDRPDHNSPVGRDHGTCATATTAPWTQQHPHRHWWLSNLPRCRRFRTFQPARRSRPGATISGDPRLTPCVTAPS